MRVLLIEDERRLAATVRRGLMAEGFAVDVTHDGVTGWNLAARYPYQVIILDIMLPGLNGYQVCARLRRDGVDTPLLMLTAKDGEYDEAEGLDTGADDYLTKPFSFVVLLARIRALVRRGGRHSVGPLRAGDLWLDPAIRRCGRAQTEIPLTAKEFSVLECLIRRPGQAVTKTEILEYAWDHAFDGDVNVVEVYISALRRKVDAPFGRRAIQTLRGYGYRLVSDDV